MNAAQNYERIKDALEYLARHYTRQPKLDEVARHVNLSEYHFQRIFREWAGVSPKKFLQYITLKALKENISHTPSLSELPESVGLSAPSRVYDLFIKVESVTPKEFQTGGKGITIDYGLHDTPLGRCLIAVTSRGICALEFIDNDESRAVERLSDQWKNAGLRKDQASTQSWIDMIFRRPDQPLSLLICGTPFQIKVWEALLKIPYGQLTTYSEIAKSLDKPGASRAVGSAIGKNPIALLIPCHRVIRKLGGLGGYKWGEARKLALIGYERAQIQNNKNLFKS